MNLLKGCKRITLTMDFQHEKYENPVLLLTGRQDISVGYQNIIEIIEEYPRRH